MRFVRVAGRRDHRSARSSWLIGAAFGLALLLVACGSTSAPVETPAELSVPLRVSINELMIQWINPASYVVWDAARDQYAPKSEADWRRLEDQALQLVASGTLTVVPGTGPQDAGWVIQPEWIEFTREMTDAADAALSSARARDLDAFLEAGNLLVESCEGCHAAYR